MATNFLGANNYHVTETYLFNVKIVLRLEARLVKLCIELGRMNLPER